MKKLEFFKLQASGNDFILINLLKKSRGRHVLRLKELARKLCVRKYGIGADGVLVIEKSRKAPFKMRIFNPDGSEAEMCGNGARCVALWAYLEYKKKEIFFETQAGVIHATVQKTKTPRLAQRGAAKASAGTSWRLKNPCACRMVESMYWVSSRISANSNITSRP